MGISYRDTERQEATGDELLRMRNKLSGCVPRNHVKIRDGAAASVRYCSSLPLKRSCKFAIASRTDSSACCRWVGPVVLGILQHR